MKRRAAILLACLLLVAAAAFALSSKLIWPSTKGGSEKKDASLTVNVGGVNDGYIMVKGKKQTKRYKLRIECGGVTMTYDLNNAGNYETFPLQLGNGSYKVSLYSNSSGKKYASAGTVKLNVKLKNPNAPYLVPSQYVNYTAKSAAVSLSDTICAGKNSNKQKFEAIRDYVRKHFVYDFMRSLNITSGILPDIDYCTGNRMGICQDLAATTACMLRVQGIPTKLVIGYIGKQYHAWNVVMLDGEEILYDPTMDLGGASKGTYSVERFY